MMQGSRHLREPSHQVLKRGLESLLGKQLWPGEVVRGLVSGPLGGKKSSAGNDKPRTLPHSMWNSNPHYPYGTGNPSKIANTRIVLELLKLPEFLVETNAKPFFRSIFTTSGSQDSRGKKEPAKEKFTLKGYECIK